jgi:hypothetical protein
MNERVQVAACGDATGDHGPVIEEACHSVIVAHEGKFDQKHDDVRGDDRVGDVGRGGRGVMIAEREHESDRGPAAGCASRGCDVSRR